MLCFVFRYKMGRLFFLAFFCLRIPRVPLTFGRVEVPVVPNTATFSLSQRIALRLCQFTFNLYATLRPGVHPEARVPIPIHRLTDPCIIMAHPCSGPTTREAVCQRTMMMMSRCVCSGTFRMRFVVSEWFGSFFFLSSSSSISSTPSSQIVPHTLTRKSDDWAQRAQKNLLCQFGKFRPGGFWRMLSFVGLSSSSGRSVTPPGGVQISNFLEGGPIFLPWSLGGRLSHSVGPFSCAVDRHAVSFA